MNRKERLYRTLEGKAVDRPAVNFYEINGFTQNPDDPNPFNIFNHPSWKPLLELAREKSDRIIMRGMPFKKRDGESGKWKAMPELEAKTERTLDENGSEITVSSIRAGKRVLTQRTKRDRDIDTVWTTEHLLKDVDDFKAWLDLPEDQTGLGEVDTDSTIDLEEKIGDSGIVMIDCSDPLCGVAPLFDMGEYTIIAMTEQELFHKALQRKARELYPQIEAVAKALPGRLWRIYGPEYASPPYLPPALFHEYVTEYVKPIVASIHKYGGFARIHCHGNLKAILDEIMETGAAGLDPVEPPPQGDVDLSYVREKYGKQLVLFGNLEASDLENLETEAFRSKVRRALDEGTRGEGRGFVLMPSSCPYGRKLTAKAMRNYEVMIEACV